MQKFFLITSFSLHFSLLSLRDWPFTWKTIVLQCYYTVGWVIWPVKSSPKWPIMCRVGRLTLQYYWDVVAAVAKWCARYVAIGGRPAGVSGSGADATAERWRRQPCAVSCTHGHWLWRWPGRTRHRPLNITQVYSHLCITYSLWFWTPVNLVNGKIKVVNYLHLLALYDIMNV